MNTITIVDLCRLIFINAIIKSTEYTVKTAVLFWHKIGHIWYYVTKKNREKQKDGTKFDPFVC